MRKLSLLLVFTLFAALISGCSVPLRSSISPTDKGQVAVAATVSGLSESLEWIGKLTFTRGKNTVEHNVAVQGTDLHAVVDVPVGTWDVTLILMDQDNVPHFRDEIKKVTVYPDKPISLEFQLRPADGTVEVTVDLAQFIQADVVYRARVHFNDTIKEIIRGDLAEPLTGKYSFPPGSYNFKVELFSESFRSSDQVHPGVWQTIHVNPLETLTITWQPAVEKLNITGVVHVLPSPPPICTATFEDTAIVVSWQPSSTVDVAGYHIYWQPSPFDPFILLTSVPADTFTYRHDLETITEEYPNVREISYSVAAYTHQVVGYHSPHATIMLP